MDRKKREELARELERMTLRYEIRNELFAAWLDRRDELRRERTASRLANVGGRGEHGGTHGR